MTSEDSIISRELSTRTAHEGITLETVAPGPPLSELFAALANDDRLAIIREVTAVDGSDRSEACITTIADQTGLSRFAASRHLSILVQAGLLSMRRDGYRKVHSLNADALTVIEDWVLDLYVDDASSILAMDPKALRMLADELDDHSDQFSRRTARLASRSASQLRPTSSLSRPNRAVTGESRSRQDEEE